MPWQKEAFVLIGAVLILTLLTAINYRIGSKAPLYPATVFCFVWAADLALIWLCGDFFYPLSPPSLAIFVCGCLFFSLGSWLALLWPMKAPRPVEPIPDLSNRILTLIVIGVVLAIPLAVRWLMNISADKGINFLGAVYSVLSIEENQISFGASLFLNLATFSNIVALVAFYERSRGKWRAVVAVLAALAVNVVGGGRTGFTTLILGLMAIDWLKNRRVRWKLITGLAILFLLLSTAMVYFVQKGGVKTDASFQENITPIAQTYALYGAGGLVAFDQVIRRPDVVEHNWQIDRFFLQTLNKFGAHFRVPPINAEFVAIGPHQQMQNVYTLYFAYMDLGYVGMMAVVLLVAFVLTLLYRRAIAGGRIAVLFYGSFFSGVMLSIYFEPFFFPWNFVFKFWAVIWFLYQLPAVWNRLKKAFAGPIAREVAQNQSL
jgi:oligosaccharide repeat unit polymerase